MGSSSVEDPCSSASFSAAPSVPEGLTLALALALKVKEGLRVNVGWRRGRLWLVRGENVPIVGPRPAFVSMAVSVPWVVVLIVVGGAAARRARPRERPLVDARVFMAEGGENSALESLLVSPSS